MPIGVPVPFGSPSYHSQTSPTAKEPPTTFKSIVPAPHKTVCVELMELGAVDAGITVIVTGFESMLIQLADLTSLLKQVVCEIIGGS